MPKFRSHTPGQVAPVNAQAATSAVEGLEPRRLFASAAAAFAVPPPAMPDLVVPETARWAEPVGGVIALRFGTMPVVRFIARPVGAPSLGAPWPAADGAPDSPVGSGTTRPPQQPRGDEAPAAVRTLPVQVAAAQADPATLAAGTKGRPDEQPHKASDRPGCEQAAERTASAPATAGGPASYSGRTVVSQADASGAEGDGSPPADAAVLAEPLTAVSDATALAGSWSVDDAIGGTTSAPSAAGVFAEAVITADAAQSASAPVSAEASDTTWTALAATAASSAATFGSSVLRWASDQVEPSGEIASEIAAVAGVAAAAYWIGTSRGEPGQEHTQRSPASVWGLLPAERT